jgi:hypothetical protein
MARFRDTLAPTPFGFFDDDNDFSNEADKMVVAVKRFMGDDILSVELTSKQIWASFERSVLQYGQIINEYQLTSHLANMLGQSTGSDVTNSYPRNNLEFLLRQAEPYSMEAGVGGSYNPVLGYLDLVNGTQEYDIYDLKDKNGNNIIDSLSEDKKSKLKIVELYHFSPITAQQFLINASNITNFLSTEMRYESYVNSTIFYVLPVFEDVLRRSMLEAAFRVRRSNYSYIIQGTKVRIFPIPTDIIEGQVKLWMRVRTAPDALNPDYTDASINAVNSPSNMGLSNIQFSKVNDYGRQWIREYTFALSRELLGLVRSKMKSIPIPNATLDLNGNELVESGRKDQEDLKTKLREFILSLTHDKLIEQQANKSENLQKQLKHIPMPLGKAIISG